MLLFESTVVAVIFMPKSTATLPVPLREIVCGLLAALSLMVTTPVRVPVAVGVKATPTVQLPPEA